MEKIRQFLARKDVVFTLQRYGIDALGAMAQGLFCTLLVGTILNLSLIHILIFRSGFRPVSSPMML